MNSVARSLSVRSLASDSTASRCIVSRNVNGSTPLDIDCQGDAEAQFLLGLSYYLDLGVPQDFAQAYFWLDLAIAGKLNASNTEQAAKFQVKIASHLTPTVLAREQERARKWFEAHRAKP